jgi:hypothetical protein
VHLQKYVEVNGAVVKSYIPLNHPEKSVKRSILVQTITQTENSLIDIANANELSDDFMQKIL